VSAAPPKKYEDDAARIDREYIPDSATSEREIAQALEDAGFPQKAQSSIEDWLVSTSDVWDSVGSDVQDANSVERVANQESGGTVSDQRAQQIGDEIASEINSARAQAAQRVDANGQARGENGQFVGSIQNVEESVESDGIYYENTNTGTKVRAASFDRGGR